MLQPEVISDSHLGHKKINTNKLSDLKLNLEIEIYVTYVVEMIWWEKYFISN